jgi:hypothetical protein
MKVLFNPFSGNFELVPVIVIQTVNIVSGQLSFGEGDLSLDAGDRNNDESVVDNGDRVIETLA